MSLPGAPPTSPSDPTFVELQKAFASGELTLFVGAGISAAAGLPGWRALVEKVVATVKARGVDAPRLEEIDELLQRGALIDALTAAKEAMGSPVQFCKLVEGLLDDSSRNVPDVAEAIAELSPHLRAVLTTNLDRLLERALKGQFRTVVRPPGDLAQQRRYLLHLHGTLHERDSWVMTREDYDRAMYANPQLQGMFSTLFHAYPLLFLGFGLADDNFDAVFARVRALSGAHPPRHFALVASETVTPSRRKRLEDSGLNLIVYSNLDGRHSEVARILRQLAGGSSSGGGAGTSGGTLGPSASGSGPTTASSPSAPRASRSGHQSRAWLPLAVGALLLSPAALLLKRPSAASLPTSPPPAGPLPAREAEQRVAGLVSPEPPPASSRPVSPPPARLLPVRRAAQHFAGFIKDEDGRPLEGVAVSLPLLRMERQTDKFGHFQFSGAYAEGADVKLSARKAGYQDSTAHGSWGNTGLLVTLTSAAGE